MNYLTQYREKLMRPEEAVRLIPRQGDMSMGMTVSGPPALLTALEERIKASSLDNIQELRVYYMHSEQAARNTILKYEYMDVIHPHSFLLVLLKGLY